MWSAPMTLGDDDETVDRHITWSMTYNDLNQLTYRYQGTWEDGSSGEERLSYTYDDNGNLTQVKTETYSGGWSGTLRWDYQWNPRDQMKKASKYVNGSLDGYVEYEYCVDQVLKRVFLFNATPKRVWGWHTPDKSLNWVWVPGCGWMTV